MLYSSYSALLSPSPQHQLQQEWEKVLSPSDFQVYVTAGLFLLKMYSFLAPLTQCKLSSKVDGQASCASSCSLYLQARDT